MNYTDWSSKLEQVLKRTDKDTLYEYLCDYAKSHEELAMALIGEFWQTEKDDYKSMVQKCLMHPTKLGAKSHEAYDWTAVACDLAKMMNLAERKEKEGNLLDAAEIARWVMILPCEEYEKDHPYGESGKGSFRETLFVMAFKETGSLYAGRILPETLFRKEGKATR